MTPQILSDAFTAAGIDTFDAVVALLSTATKQVALRAIDLKIEALNSKQADALYPIQQERSALQTERKAIVDEMTATAAK